MVCPITQYESVYERIQNEWKLVINQIIKYSHTPQYKYKDDCVHNIFIISLGINHLCKMCIYGCPCLQTVCADFSSLTKLIVNQYRRIPFQLHVKKHTHTHT